LLLLDSQYCQLFNGCLGNSLRNQSKYFNNTEKQSLKPNDYFYTLMIPYHFTIPVFVPELACPNRCVFCNQRNISGTLCQPSDGEIIEIIEQRLGTIPAGSKVEIGFFGGNFTGIPMTDQEHLLKLVQPYLKNGDVSSIRISTRPDHIDAKRLDLLRRYFVRTIELGAQSLDDEVMKLTGRGHTVNDVRNASKMILAGGFSLGLQMMIGLPGDTLNKSLQTADEIVRLGAVSTRIYPTLVIKDTELETLYLDGKYKSLSLEEAVNWAKAIVPVFEKGGVKIIRLGLHPSEGLLHSENLVAGPFHVSFAELVYTELWKDMLLPYTLGAKAGKIAINVAEGQVNAAVGYNGKNRDMLKQKYARVKFHGDPALKGREFYVDFS
jgi:histone acetyltransferase (RNA polymerase elongator complex component)